ncbi:acyltransferase family protein [Spirosoma gilvum]
MTPASSTSPEIATESKAGLRSRLTSRLTSLDVFRGMTVMLMTIVNNPGDWATIYAPLKHAEWHGCTPTDLVFPSFLFIVGISTVLSMPERRFNAVVLEKIVTRFFRIFLLGLFQNFFLSITVGSLDGVPLLLVRLVITAIIMVLLLDDYDRRRQLYVAIGLFVFMMVLAYGGFEAYNDVRIPGVLQRIAIVYLIISILYLTTSTTTQLIVGLVCLLGYWAAMALIPVPGIGPANYEKATNLSAWLDSVLLPHHVWTVSKTWDPEGTLSTIPAIGTGLIGVFTGQLLANSFAKSKKAMYLLGAGMVGILVGLLWNTSLPINKILWSSSYVLYAAGIALVILGILYYLIEVKELGGAWTKPFVIFGMNPIVVFFVSGIIPRALLMIHVAQPGNVDHPQVNLKEWLYNHLFLPYFADPKNASLAGAITYLFIWFGILVWFYKRKLFVKV